MNDEVARPYSVLQLGPPDRLGRQVNIPVADLESIVTHHPRANMRARMVDGTIIDAERQKTRSHAFIGGEFQEIETRRTDEYRSLEPHQALLIKDFILEDRTSSRWSRELDIPSPFPGHVSRRDDRNGVVEISVRPDGYVMARVRHLSDIAVAVGDRVHYGQALGTQGNRGLGLPSGEAIHVHIEVDTRHYGAFGNYVDDLVSGRLAQQASLRRNLEPLPVAHDGTYRLGESHPRIRDLQRVMANEGYRAAGGGELDRDGVYRLGMQGALLDFQRDHGVRQSGDIDPATLQFAPVARSRERDLPDHFQPGQPLPRLPARGSAPGHPDHHDHRPELPSEPEPRINQRAGQRSGMPQALDRLSRALQSGDEQALSSVCADIARMPQLDALLRDLRARAIEPEPVREPPAGTQPALALS